MQKGKQQLLYVLSSVASLLVDNALYYVLELLLGSVLGQYTASVCYLIARACSSFLNFNLNRLVFGRKGSYGKSLLRYYCLALPVALAGSVFTNLFTSLFRIQTPEGSSAVKLVVDGALYVVNYLVQKAWVFKDDNKKT